MRNFVTSILPPKARLMVPITPPMKEREQALIFTIRGTETASVREINRALVCVTNESDKIAPVLVCVGPADLIPSWLAVIQQGLRLLKGNA